MSLSTARFTRWPAVLRGTTFFCGGSLSPSDQKFDLLATGRVTYPEISLACGALEIDPADSSRSTITNPTLLVEVLSPSTEDVDRISKRRDYQRIPSLQEYVLVSQDEPRV